MEKDGVIGPLDPRAIGARIPHRYPFAFLDGVQEMKPGAWARGSKQITRNEAVFEGHFPGQPIWPGVLTLEALAQLAGVCFAEDREEQGLGVFAGMDQVKFRRPVRPGDRLDLFVELERRRGPLVRVRAEARVGDELVAEGRLTFSYVTELTPE